MEARSGLSPRSLLAPLAWGYALAIRLRNRWYDQHAEAISDPGLPVISVGNITTGGTGKTPMVIEIVRHLLERGRRPAIVTRGYGARSGAMPDEVQEFQAALPDVPVVVDPDRTAGARRARDKFDADCVVLDDGFQHRRIARKLDIVLIDALHPWGGGAMLPAGRLREPLTSLARADLLVITRSNQVLRRKLAEIESKLVQHCDRPVIHAAVEPVSITDHDGNEETAESIAYDAVLPVCGVGNPDTFLHMVAMLASRVCRPMRYRDHHNYHRRDVRAICEQARAQDANLVLTTRKDWVKLAPLWPASDADTPRLARLDVRLALHDADGVLDEALDAALETN